MHAHTHTHTHILTHTLSQVLLLAMKDMNVAKLTAVDLPLFNGITSDLFPGVDVPQLDYGVVRYNSYNLYP